MIKIAIAPDRFDAGAELKPLAELSGGAVASFTGIARPDGDVVAIELEHYPAMTNASLQALVNEARTRWSLLGCVLIHRVGIINMREEIVLVGTAALHRKAALEACAFLIDRLKTDAPFWKKEIHADGNAIWVDAKVSDNEAGAKWI